jgi:antitoxin (DNA-binding transcriptional repressor) of toxin-antitoxin stability system
MHQPENRLSDPIDQSLAGEPVVITGHRHPIVEQKPVRRRRKPVTPEDLDWLAARRVEMNSSMDAGTLVSRMRDEDER